MTKLDKVLAEDVADRSERWRSAMHRTWAAGDVMVGVTKSLTVSLFTIRDATKVTEPSKLAEALNQAENFARRAARRSLTA